MCVFIVIATEFDYRINLVQPVPRVALHAVESLNVKHESRSKKIRAVLYHADISKRYFWVCHLKIVFYFWHELKQRSRSSDVTGRHLWPVDSDVTEGVITTRSNRMKFRLGN